jgi:hypothetical protein
MPRKDMKKALGASLKAEEQAVKSRFERAETALSGKGAANSGHSDNASKVIRDSFTMPSVDYELIPAIKTRCLKAGVSVNKSEILRAGLNALESMSDKELLKVVNGLVKVKPGRPTT